MSIRNTPYIRSRFVPGSIPTSADFCDLIDTTRTTVAQVITSAMGGNGMFFLEEGLSFSTRGGGALSAIVTKDTTADMVDLLTYSHDVFVSGDFAVVGTAGVSAVGTINTGVQLSLKDEFTPKWHSAGNRITVDDRGRVVKTSLVPTDFGFTYYTQMAGSAQYISVIHPHIASARSVVIHCSGVAPVSSGTILARFCTSSAVAVTDEYRSNMIWGDTTAPYYPVNAASSILLNSSGNVSSTGTTNISVTMYPVPSGKTAFAEFYLRDNSPTPSQLISGGGTLVAASDTTITGIQLRVSNNVLFKNTGSYQVVVS